MAMKDPIRRDLKAWNIREKWASDREKREKERSLQDPLLRNWRRRRQTDIFIRTNVQVNKLTIVQDNWSKRLPLRHIHVASMGATFI